MGLFVSRSAAACSTICHEQHRGRLRAEETKDFAHFLDVAKGSCGEVRSMLYVAEDLRYLPAEEAQAMRYEAEMLSCGIAAFTKHLRS
jgi:four helix bundle protein